MQETVCSRASSVGIPTAPDAKKVREINDLLLDIIGRHQKLKEKENQGVESAQDTVSTSENGNQYKMSLVSAPEK